MIIGMICFIILNLFNKWVFHYCEDYAMLTGIICAIFAATETIIYIGFITLP